MAARARRVEHGATVTMDTDDDSGQLHEAAVVDAVADVLGTALEDLGGPDEGEQGDAPDLVEDAVSGEELVPPGVDPATGELMGQQTLALESTEPEPSWEALGKAFAKVERAAVELAWGKEHVKGLKAEYETALSDLRSLGMRIRRRELAAASGVVIEASVAAEADHVARAGDESPAVDDQAGDVAEEDDGATDEAPDVLGAFEP